MSATTEAPTQGAATEDRNRSFTAKVPSWVYSVIIAIGITASAEFVAKREWVSELILPAPSAVLNALIDGFSTGVYWKSIWSTVSAMTTGFLIATIIAFVIAGIMSTSPRIEEIMLPFVVAFQTLPKIAVAPLIVLWLGFDNTGKTFVVVIVCFFPIVINTLQGLKLRNLEQYELMLSLGASRWQIFRYIRVPGAVPYIFAGLHIGIIFALIGTVVSEFVGSRSGLGYFMLSQKAAFNVPGVFASLILLLIVGLTAHGIMVLIERRFAFWAGDVAAEISA